MGPNDELPDFFDQLAAICKFVAVKRISPNFYKQHANACEMASAFIGVIGGHHLSLREALRTSLPQPISEGSEAIRRIMPTLGLSEEEAKWIDDQMTVVLKLLYRVVCDPGLPSWLSECKWAIEGAFESEAVFY